MHFKVGDFVTRGSYNNDIVFKIIRLVDKVAYLKGANLRIYADSDVNDLFVYNGDLLDDNVIISRNKLELDVDRDEYFYLPGKILHIDGDEEYLNRCMNFYNNMNVLVSGVCLSEDEIAVKMEDLLNEYKPDILVITGHDSYNEKKSKKYKNTDNFIYSVKEARRYEKNQDKLIIVAGACQSNYEELIRAGANFASSPKRINIHALDPAIVASCLSFSDKNNNIDIIKILDKTKYGSDGMGGIITKGSMYIGYPR